MGQHKKIRARHHVRPGGQGAFSRLRPYGRADGGLRPRRYQPRNKRNTRKSQAPLPFVLSAKRSKDAGVRLLVARERQLNQMRIDQCFGDPSAIGDRRDELRARWYQASERGPARRIQFAKDIVH